MSLGPELVLLIGLSYVALLFGVAFLADWRMANNRWRWLNSPLVYTLSISIYCTSWTFYGAVGMAARGGLEFATIYLGPTLVFVGWWAFMRKLVRISQSQGVTSIADFISARYGKSAPVAALVTLIAVVSTLPYIALQLKAVAATFHLLITAQSGELNGGDAFKTPPVDEAIFRIAFWLAAGLALFGILFGARTLDARERHHGLVAAIALEALVKLAALTAVGLFALFVVSDGPAALFDSPEAREFSAQYLENPDVYGARWAGLTFLAGVAVICLPRQFHVTVVECVDEDHGRTAAWAFPLYLFVICLFVLPIMLVGLSMAPEGADPDMFVLTLPLAEDAQGLALLAFLGGFSSATSMVIVACVALSIMVSNHLVMPLADSGFRGVTPEAGDVRRFLLGSRRVSICAILLLSFLYFRLSSETEPLASIGLISFVGVAQLLPSLVAAMYWPRATARGAVWGMSAGFACWLLLLFGPSLGDAALFDAAAAVADLGSGDTLMTAMFWSLCVNLLFLAIGSLTRPPTPLEQSQSAAFVEVFRRDQAPGWREVSNTPPSGGDVAQSQALYVLAQRILGAEAALRLLEQERARQGVPHGMPVADSAFVERLERLLARSVGASSARAMVMNVVSGESVGLQELIGIADETQQLVDYSHELEAKSTELEKTAAQLRAANVKLKRLDAQKDEFLSQISHELRTPMTSIRAFAEILRDSDDLSRPEEQKFLQIIDDESLRLTRLLDQILDLSQLERGQARLRLEQVDPEEALDRAIETCEPLANGAAVAIHRHRAPEPIRLLADSDRLRQVFLNVLVNAVKYNTNPSPEIWIESRRSGALYEAVISDNGPGVSEADRAVIFSQFVRGASAGAAPGAGLGLAISRQILERHGGSIEYVGDLSSGGAAFRIRLPLR